MSRRCGRPRRSVMGGPRPAIPATRRYISAAPGAWFNYGDAYPHGRGDTGVDGTG